MALTLAKRLKFRRPRWVAINRLFQGFRRRFEGGLVAPAITIVKRAGVNNRFAARRTSSMVTAWISALRLAT
jgi:hypothetical protein